MCGILGLITNNDNFFFKTKKKFNSYLDLLNHRGPDSKNYYYNNQNKIILGNTRLSITDINERSNQPMFSDDKKVVLIFNGEIYNYKDLQKKLLNNNSSLKTNSDTEIILRLYEIYGDNFVNYLDGMFAISILDNNRKKIYLFRDRIGKKPLYIFRNCETIIFSSEISPINKIVNNLSLNKNKLSDFLQFGFVFNNETIVENIKKIPPSYTATIDFNLDFNVTRFNTLINTDEIKNNYNIDELITNAVKKRIPSDLKNFGLFISAGLDSTIIAKKISTLSSNVECFHLAIKEFNSDESYNVKKIVSNLNLKYNEVNFDFKESISTTSNLFKQMSDPIGDPSIIPSYYLCSKIPKNLKVMFNGDGGDEFFYGYRRYNFIKSYNFLKKIRPINNILMNFFFLLKKKNIRIFNYLERIDRILYSKCFSEFVRIITEDGFSEDELKKNSSINTATTFNELTKLDNEKLSLLQKVNKFDKSYVLPNNLLIKSDTSSMLNSLEIRSPFLDIDLISFANKINSNFHVSLFNKKKVIKQYAKDFLPKNILNFPKHGFEIPLENMINKHYKDIIIDTLKSKNSIIMDIFEKNYILNLINLNSHKTNNDYKKIWFLFVLSKWYENNF